MGGIRLINELNDFATYKNNHLITAQASVETEIVKIFYASSTSIYPQEKLLNHNELNLKLKETDVWYFDDDEPEFKDFIIFLESNNWVGGSENALASIICRDICSINENGNYKMEMLAYIAFEAIGKSREQVKLITNENKPIDVQNRNSDNTLINQVLGWSPKTSIRKGMEKTTTLVKNEIEKELNELVKKELKKIDKDDALFHPKGTCINAETHEFDLPPGSICKIVMI
ncbi:14018_t:CDS:2 [Dentiscutata heterogama]|uniref:14018_t:CDS:1 n=1 Tax=Dentiscutata heterogama TaxID=1316150 RepID=A0ACA9K4Q4_9GLOM|nr:14018_t:CDS:2 [Dentiscutata heterogama]